MKIKTTAKNYSLYIFLDGVYICTPSFSTYYSIGLVCRNLPEDSDREIGNLLDIKDNYPKYVVTLDELAGGNMDGVKIMHLSDFLLNDRL